jgi:hypothetical protein
MADAVKEGTAVPRSGQAKRLSYGDRLEALSYSMGPLLKRGA